MHNFWNCTINDQLVLRREMEFYIANVPHLMNNVKKVGNYNSHVYGLP